MQASAARLEFRAPQVAASELGAAIAVSAPHHAAPASASETLWHCLVVPMSAQHAASASCGRARAAVGPCARHVICAQCAPNYSNTMPVDLGEVLEFAVHMAKMAGAEIVKGSESRHASSGA